MDNFWLKNLIKYITLIKRFGLLKNVSYKSQLRLVFPSHGDGVGDGVGDGDGVGVVVAVGVVVGVVRDLMKIGVVNGVISLTESESEESERFHFF